MYIKIKLMLVLCLLFALSDAAFAQDECEIVNKIIDSGLDRQNPFAAVAKVMLPNADRCKVEFGDDDDERNLFTCSWNEKNAKILEKLEEEEDELFYAHEDHDGGGDALDEAKEFIDKANYWYRTYNTGLRLVGQPRTHEAAALFAQWKAKGDAFKRKARAKEQEAKVLDQEKNEAEARHDAKVAERGTFEEEFEKLSNRQAGQLYTGLYACFDSGTIHNAETYTVNSQDNSWTQKMGCTIDIDAYHGPHLNVKCPNFNYQGQ